MEKKAEDILSEKRELPDQDGFDRDPQHRLARYMIISVKNRYKPAFDEQDKEKLWERIEKTTKRHPQASPGLNWRKWLIAATLIGFVLFVSWLVLQKNRPSAVARIAQQKSYLLKDTGSVRWSSGKDRDRLLDKNETLDLRTQPAESGSEGQYSTLTVPFGKYSSLVLPDGSKVRLNAGSQFTFPNRFAAGQREVYLEGEAYFDIAPDTKSPFVVHSSNLDIQVLGTSFNVSSYKGDPYATTAVVSGKVQVQIVGTTDQGQVLMAGNRAVLKKNEKQLLISTGDTESDISWTKSQLILKSVPLAEVLVKLERIYNAAIQTGAGIDQDETFSGALDVTQPLDLLLEGVFDGHVYDIQKEGRQISIKKKVNEK